MIKRLFKNIILIFLLITIVNANETIDINSKIKIAQKENKHLMVFFHIPHCPYCARMLKKNFKDGETLKEIEDNFIFVDLYTKDKSIVKFNDFSGSIKEFASYIGATAYPATFFIDQDKKTIFKSIGYRNTNELLLEIKYIATQSYQTIDLEAFILKLEFEDDD